MTNLNLGITPPATARPARLRADRIRRDTLIRLAAALREDDEGHLQNALDALVDAVPNPLDVDGNEIDALVADIEELADMGRADLALSPADLEQVADEAVHAVAIAGGSVWKRGGRPAAPAKCGTYSGYQSHHARGEKPCWACRDARRERDRAYYADHRDQVLARRRAGGVR